MQSECTYTRKRLVRYLSGRLFALQRRRVERHLGRCQVCRSQFDALCHVEETRRVLDSVDPAQGLGRLRAAVSASRQAFVRLFYRPLWLLLILASVAAAYQYVIHPLLHDPDLERLGVPAQSASPPPHQVAASAPSVSTAAETKAHDRKSPAKQPSASPLLVTITVDRENEAASIRRINEAMKEHALLRSMRFGKSVREISGSLTAEELHAFFNRIDGAGRISYRRSRLASASGEDLIPFVLRLVSVSPPPPPPVAAPKKEQTVEKSVQQEAEKQAEKPVEKPVETSTPTAPPVSRVAPTTPQGQ